MKLSTIAVALALSVPCLATAQSVEQQLKKLEMQWDEAGVKKDAAVYDPLLADDFTLTGPNGNLVTKAQFTGELKTGEDIVYSSVLSDMKVRVYGDTEGSDLRGKSEGDVQGPGRQRHISLDGHLGEAWRLLAVRSKPRLQGCPSVTSPRFHRFRVISIA
jgi:hypothetical protein